MKVCPICKSSIKKIFRVKVLKRYTASLNECVCCKFAFFYKPNWLKEAYKNPINIEDTGIIQRNIRNLKIVISFLRIVFHKKAIILDFAGGYGILVRLLRDFGFLAYWQDKFTPNLFSRGFEFKGKKADLVTSFEVLEHVEDPLKLIKQMLKISPVVLLSTELLPDIAPSPRKYWYYGFEHGQHISFYREKTFHNLARQLQISYVKLSNGYHLFSKKSKRNIMLLLAFKFYKIIYYLHKINSSSLTQKDHNNIKNLKNK